MPKGCRTNRRTQKYRRHWRITHGGGINHDNLRRIFEETFFLEPRLLEAYENQNITLNELGPFLHDQGVRKDKIRRILIHLLVNHDVDFEGTASQEYLNPVEKKHLPKRTAKWKHLGKKPRASS